jgi:hypothetical protein
MPKVNLSEPIIFNGATYGPGEGVEVPDDKNLLARIEYFNEEFKLRNDAAMKGALSVLPAGHPYNMMFPQINNQPPEFEGEAVSPASSYLQVASAVPTLYGADGATVSGTSAASEDPFKPGQQVPTAVDPADTVPKELSSLADLTPPEVSSETPEAPTKAPAPAPAPTTSSGGTTTKSSSS